jgi:hypothetical protein
MEVAVGLPFTLLKPGKVADRKKSPDDYLGLLLHPPPAEHFLICKTALPAGKKKKKKEQSQ